MLDQPHSERRRSERQRSLLRARMTFEGMTSSIECEIRNMSSGGVAIAIDGTLPIPPEFTLEIPTRSRVSKMHTAWRGADRLGASFVDPLRQTRPGAVADPDQRLRELEAENAQLRQKLTRLQSELAMRAALDEEGI